MSNVETILLLKENFGKSEKISLNFLPKKRKIFDNKRKHVISTPLKYIEIINFHNYFNFIIDFAQSFLEMEKIL